MTTNLAVGTNQPASITDPNPIHMGSWGLPDFGLTESIGSLINGGGVTTTYQGGSDIIPNKTTTSSGATVNTSDAGSIKAAYPGYAGWSDQAILADYAATGGSGKGGTTSGGTSGGTPAPTQSTYTIRGTNTTAGSPEGALNNVIPTNDYSAFKNQMDPTQFLNQIESSYSGQNEFYNTQENALKAAQDTFNKTIEADYAANLAKANQSKVSTAGQLSQNEVLAAQKKQDALNSAKQLYNQLQQGYRQRFGGATSAGEAANTILGEEQQRQSGLIGRDYTTAISDIARQKVDLENSYTTAIADLDRQKQQATSEVMTNYTNQLSQITANRAQSYQAKEQAKLQILLDARNQLATIQQNNDNYIKNLQAIRAEQTGTLDQFIQQLQGTNTGYANKAATSVSKIPTTVTSNLGQNNATVKQDVLSSTTPQIESSTGQISTPRQKYWWEP